MHSLPRTSSTKSTVAMLDASEADSKSSQTMRPLFPVVSEPELLNDPQSSCLWNEMTTVVQDNEQRDEEAREEVQRDKPAVMEHSTSCDVSISSKLSTFSDIVWKIPDCDKTSFFHQPTPKGIPLCQPPPLYNMMHPKPLLSGSKRLRASSDERISIIECEGRIYTSRDKEDDDDDAVEPSRPPREMKSTVPKRRTFIKVPKTCREIERARGGTRLFGQSAAPPLGPPPFLLRHHQSSSLS